MRDKMAEKPRAAYEFMRHLLAFGISAIVWLASALAADWNDPQSTILYWKVSYPILIICSGILGIIFPDRPWRWALNLIAAQFGMGIFTLKGDPNLLPLGIVLHLIMAVPFLFFSFGGAWASRSWKNKRKDKGLAN